MALLWALAIAAVIIFSSFFSISASAQSNTGRILGTVTDQTGAPIAGASVTITDVQRGLTHNLTTTAAGEYVAPDLLPAIYQVRIEAAGFKTSERTDIRIEVATDAQIDFPLQPGQATETVVVSGQVPLINTTSSSLGGTLSNKEINDLPLNGRNYENLLQLRPGIVRYPAADSPPPAPTACAPRTTPTSWMGSSTASPSPGKASSTAPA